MRTNLTISRGHVLWRDDFVKFFGSVYPDWLFNNRWGDVLQRWNARTLPDNGDKQLWVTDGFAGIDPSVSVANILTSEGNGSPPFLHVCDGNTLRLRAYPINEGNANAYLWGYRYVAGIISEGVKSPDTGKSFGTWTIRFRFNAFGQGQHLAIWLVSDDASWPPEIDILEVINNQDIWYANTHPVTGSDPLFSYTRPGAANDWYVLNFTLTPDFMVWSVNGNIVREKNNDWPIYRYCLNVTWEISTNWTLSPDASTPWPADVEIDYITFDW